MNNYKPILSDHLVKEEVRQDIITELKLITKRKGRILTLPCLNFDIETKALELGYIVNTCEVNPIIFNKQKELRSEMDVNVTKPNGRYRLWLNNESMFTYLWRRQAYKFDCVYADFCGNLSREVRHTLIELSDRCNLLYITLYLSREHANFKHLIGKGDRMEEYKDIFSDAGYRIEKIYRYQNRRCPMATFKLIREKG